MDAATVIRTAAIGDLDAMVDVHTQARTAYYRAGGLADAEFADPAEHAQRIAGWRQAIGGGRHLTLCAVRGERVVGVLSMGTPNEGVCELYQIHVRPGSWGLGIGGRLHAAYVAALRDAGAPYGRLCVWERNARARAFYACHGWRADGQRTPGPGGTEYLGMRLAAG
ncbi:GNAT family N-acetyltransferase [Streptomyces silvisoli]|uniref:GNAT family N-acetyltransferase n=1 Tax=Streptomyces silvisoli TaxID=3034235 RepID=A0ABT5ZKQ6_9ACTN|nr:GNAT family N-acetyltransferase [Streptomyces silvisoli]MDF3290419.1 GNAT family N-acetyltransferase [Streptomyces silvisoli]